MFQDTKSVQPQSTKFLYASNKESENLIMKTMPFYTGLKKQE